MFVRGQTGKGKQGKPESKVQKECERTAGKQTKDQKEGVKSKLKEYRTSSQEEEMEERRRNYKGEGSEAGQRRIPLDEKSCNQVQTQLSFPLAFAIPQSPISSMIDLLSLVRRLVVWLRHLVE